jgi:hypothetical protein
MESLEHLIPEQSGKSSPCAYEKGVAHVYPNSQNDVSMVDSDAEAYFDKIPSTTKYKMRDIKAMRKLLVYHEAMAMHSRE